MTWTPGFVAQRFREAAKAIDGLPTDRPKKPRTAMPAAARDDKDAWLQAGQDGDPWGLYRHDDPKPDTDRSAIAALDQVLGWRSWVEHNEWRILWAWALSVPDKRVMRKLGGISRVTLWRWRRNGMVKICTKLNRLGEPCPYAEVGPSVFNELYMQRET